MEIIDIKNIKKQKLGGKAIGLKRLLEYNVPVPVAFVIDAEFIEALIDNNIKIIKKMEDFLSVFDPADKFAIRSSASNEDGEENSFAGMYDTVLNVSFEIDKIIEAVQTVYKSAVSKKIASYTDQISNMNIIIQKMINPKIAGVCFTKAIDLDGEEVSLIEYVEGLADKLVSGKTTPKMIVANLKNMTYRSDDNVNEKIIIDLLKYLRQISNMSNQDLDIEWCIDENNKAFFVQARPITKSILIRSKTSNGSVASSGVCNGNIYIIDEDADDEEIEKKIEDFPQGAVLIAKTTDTNYVPAMRKASGIITTEGSVLSHAAIISRELGLPCITGFKNAFDIFQENNLIRFDTNSKKIFYNNKIIPFGDGKEVNELELYLFDEIIEEIINGSIVLVEECENEFGIHIQEDLNQNQIDEIETFIRKKYKKAPIILKDQKYLWYFEFKKYMLFPGYKELVQECNDVIESLDEKKIDLFVQKVCSKMKEVKEACSTDYEKLFAGEYAQATHFLINLYMCNGLAMKKLIIMANENGYSSLDELLNSNKNNFNAFFKKIESIREKIWNYYVKNGWSDDEYYDNREENMKSVLNYSKDDVADYFYKTLKISSNLESIISEDYKKKTIESILDIR